MSNFDFVQETLPQVHADCRRAESYVSSDPRSACFYSRRAIEVLVAHLYDVLALSVPYKTDLAAMVNDAGFKTVTGNGINKKLNLIRQVANTAVHDARPIRPDVALRVVQELFHVLVWAAYHHSAHPEGVPTQAQFDPALAVKSAPLSRHELVQLAAKFQAQDAAYAKQLAEKDELAAAKDAEIAELRARIEAAQTANTQADDHDYSEAETRDLYIDVLLAEAGWPVISADAKGLVSLEYAVGTMPNSASKGFVDYVLWGADWLPLAVVEAKRTTVSPQVGQQQASLYADSLQATFGRRPVIFFTNGYEHWLWDDVGGYPPREVQGFYTRGELELLIQRRQTRLPLAGGTVNAAIAGRPYQMRAIKAISEAFDAEQREALLVMATGSGKTRTVIALVDVLMKANWVKRVLFLADRTALVNQAVGVFKALLPGATTVNLVTEKLADGRVYVSTYPTMLNLINAMESGPDEQGVRRFGPGYFDLIVIDEAHRSVYQKYGSIFDWFDSLLVGLTPRRRTRSTTIRIACSIWRMASPLMRTAWTRPSPTDFWSRRVGSPSAPSSCVKAFAMTSWPRRRRTNGTPRIGVRTGPRLRSMPRRSTGSCSTRTRSIRCWGRSCWRDTRSPAAIGWARRSSLRGIRRTRSSSSAGSTRNIRSTPAGSPGWITHNVAYAQNLLDDFSIPEKSPHIAISVDMLDTGIDVPDVVNLVFFKPVHAKSKFWQMIGRGTRLRPDLFGPGEDKKDFLVFDFCGNLDFFSQNLPSSEGSNQKSLTQRLFEARLALIISHADPGVEMELRDSHARWLHEFVAGMTLDNVLVRPHRRQVEAWNDWARWSSVSADDAAELLKLAGLPSTIRDPDEEAKRFDLLILRRQLAQLEGDAVTAERIRETVQAISAALLTKKAIPSVVAQLALIDEVAGDAWWVDVTLPMLEVARLRLRTLVRFVDRVRQNPVYTDFRDTLENARPVNLPGTTPGMNFERFRSKAAAYLKEHADHIALQRLRRNKQLTPDDLTSLEEMLAASGGQDAHLAQASELSGGLGLFIRQLIGLDREAAMEAFEAYLDDGKFTVNQIRFVSLIIDELTANGLMDAGRLFESPYTDHAPTGPDFLFPDADVEVIVDILHQVRDHAIPNVSSG